MGHEFHSESHKLLDNVVCLPSSVGLLDLSVVFIVLECEKVLFGLDEGEHLDVLVDLLPYGFGVDLELEQASVLESDQQLMVVFFVGVFVQFVDLAQREMQQLVNSLDEDLVIAQDKRHLHVMPERIFRQHEFTIDQDRHLPLHCLVPLDPEVLPTLPHLHEVVPFLLDVYLTSPSSSTGSFLADPCSLPPKLTICMSGGLLWGRCFWIAI